MANREKSNRRAAEMWTSNQREEKRVAAEMWTAFVALLAERGVQPVATCGCNRGWFVDQGSLRPTRCDECCAAENLVVVDPKRWAVYCEELSPKNVDELQRYNLNPLVFAFLEEDAELLHHEMTRKTLLKLKLTSYQKRALAELGWRDWTITEMG